MLSVCQYTVGRCEILDRHLPTVIADNGAVVILTRAFHMGKSICDSVYVLVGGTP